MIIDKIITQSEFEIDKNTILLITDNNVEIIGNYLDRLGYRWKSHLAIFATGYFKPDILIFIKDDKKITFSNASAESDRYKNEEIYNYIFYEIEL